MSFKILGYTRNNRTRIKQMFTFDTPRVVTEHEFLIKLNDSGIEVTYWVEDSEVNDFISQYK